ncbi:MAG: hypothetical protein NZO58_02265 [Gemmataceae bacterium]|nr:hypothetical protein [Gemmataceae bacterium]
MAIPLTCTCGARLEIDDKFAGQTITCPDCYKPIATPAPKLVATSTSGLAVLSLVLALVGALTIVGTLAAVVCGAVAYRRLSRAPGPVGGVRLAQAGMLLGGVLTLLAIAAYGSRELFDLDGLIRSYRWAGKLRYPSGDQAAKKRGDDDSTYVIQRPTPRTDWAVLDTQSSQRNGDHLMLVNPRADAYILWLSFPEPLDKDAVTLRDSALDFFRESDLVRMIGRLPENVSQTWKPRDIQEGDNDQQFIVDVRLDGILRTFLFRVKVERRYVNVLVGGTRWSRFDRLKHSLQQALASFRFQESGR